MARRYYASNTTSDLSGAGTTNLYMLPNIVGTSTAKTITTSSSATSYVNLFTQPLDPGSAGISLGEISISINVTTANSNITFQANAIRIASDGTVQSSTPVVVFGTLSTTGVKTISLAGLSLGNFSSTERLRINMHFVNGAMNSQSFTFSVLNSSTAVNTSYNAKKSMII